MKHALVGFLMAGTVSGAAIFTSQGVGISSPNDDERISLREGSRNGRTRRAHFYGGYVGGK